MGRRGSPGDPGRRIPRTWTFLVLLAAALAAPGGWSTLPPAALHAATAVRTTESAASLPRHQVLRRSLQADPSQEYLVYVPTSSRPGASILVTTHGISRNAEEHATLFAPFAEQRGVVLVAPYFPEAEFGDYQRLGSEGRGRRPDVALEAILAEVESLTGASEGKFYLFGFSGGAQFAHRFVMAH